jgi:hypothetical protein
MAGYAQIEKQMATILSSRIHSNDVVASYSVLLPLEEHLTHVAEPVWRAAVDDNALDGLCLPIFVVLRAAAFLRRGEARTAEHHSMEIDTLDSKGYYISGMQVYTPRNGAIQYLMIMTLVARTVDSSARSLPSGSTAFASLKPNPSRSRSPARPPPVPHGPTTSAEPTSSGVTRPYVPH